LAASSGYAVFTVTAVETVSSIATRDVVVSGFAEHCVVAGTGDDDVVT
jgi:hypothetical protein